MAGMATPPEPSTTGPFDPSVSMAAGPGGAAARVPPSPVGKRPSAAGYWIAGVVIAIGAVVAVVWFIAGISDLFGAVDDYPRFRVPGSISAPLDAGDYKVFAEYPGASNGIDGVFRVGDVTVVDENGSQIRVSSSITEQTYSWNGHEGRSIAEFTAPRTGDYTISAAEPASRSGLSNVTVAVGKGIEASSVLSLIAAAGLGGLSLLIGIVLIVVTAVRRGRARRRDHPAPQFAVGYPGAYPGAYPGGYPPGSPPYGTWAPPTGPGPGGWGAPVPPGPGQWGQPGQPGSYGQPASYGQPSQWGGPPPGQPGPPPGPPPDPSGGYPVGSAAPVTPSAQAPEAPPIVPPGWGAAPGASGAEAPDQPGEADRADPGDR